MLRFCHSLWYQKKFRPGVNFINILLVQIGQIFQRQKISNPKHSFVIFGAKVLIENRLSETLMKLMAVGFSICPHFLALLCD